MNSVKLIIQKVFRDTTKNQIIIAVFVGTAGTVIGGIILAIIPNSWSALTSTLSRMLEYGIQFLNLAVTSVSVPAILILFLLLCFVWSVIRFAWRFLRSRSRGEPRPVTIEDYKADVIEGVLWKWKDSNREIKGYCVTCMTPLATYLNGMEDHRHYHCETCKVERLTLPAGIWDQTPAPIQRQIERRTITGDWKNSFQRVKHAENRAKAVQ